MELMYLPTTDQVQLDGWLCSGRRIIVDLIGRKETPKLGGRCFISCGEMNVHEGETERYNFVSLLALYPGMKKAFHVNI